MRIESASRLRYQQGARGRPFSSGRPNRSCSDRLAAFWEVSPSAGKSIIQVCTSTVHRRVGLPPEREAAGRKPRHQIRNQCSRPHTKMRNVMMNISWRRTSATSPKKGVPRQRTFYGDQGRERERERESRDDNTLKTHSPNSTALRCYSILRRRRLTLGGARRGSLALRPQDHRAITIVKVAETFWIGSAR